MVPYRLIWCSKKLFTRFLPQSTFFVSKPQQTISSMLHGRNWIVLESRGGRNCRGFFCHLWTPIRCDGMNFTFLGQVDQTLVTCCLPFLPILSSRFQFYELFQLEVFPWRPEVLGLYCKWQDLQCITCFFLAKIQKRRSSIFFKSFYPLKCWKTIETVPLAATLGSCLWKTKLKVNLFDGMLLCIGRIL